MLLTRTLFAGVVVAAALARAQEVRPVRDSVGFCWDAAEMGRLGEVLATMDTVAVPAAAAVAGISPHDDYLYAGRVYAPLYRAIRAKEVVVFGVTHGAVRREIGDPQGVLILEDFDFWRGLVLPVEVSPLRRVIRTQLPPSRVLVSRRAHLLEHSIEAVVPFLLVRTRDVRITPIMVTAMSWETADSLSDELSAVLARYIRSRGLKLGADIAFLVSSDANHYGRDFENTPFGEDAGALRRGTEYDQGLVRNFLAGPITDTMLRDLATRLWPSGRGEPPKTAWCGRYAVPVGLLTALKTARRVTGRSIEGSLLLYSTTVHEGVLPIRGTAMGTTAPFSFRHWVGFFSSAYYLAER